MKKVVLMLLALLLLTCVSAFAESENSEFGTWELEAYVDEFDMPTDRYFIVGIADTGKFSNSATTNSELVAALFCMDFKDNHEEYIRIRLLEYGNHFVQNIFSKTKYYDVIMMDNDKNKYTLTGEIRSNDEGILILDEDVETVKKVLKKGGTVRFAITEHDSPLTKYIFSFSDATGFDKAYDAWKK